jgi:hypothetical protein
MVFIITIILLTPLFVIIFSNVDTFKGIVKFLELENVTENNTKSSDKINSSPIPKISVPELDRAIEKTNRRKEYENYVKEHISNGIGLELVTNNINYFQNFFLSRSNKNLTFFGNVKTILNGKEVNIKVYHLIQMFDYDYQRFTFLNSVFFEFDSDIISNDNVYKIPIYQNITNTGIFISKNKLEYSYNGEYYLIQHLDIIEKINDFLEQISEFEEFKKNMDEDFECIKDILIDIQDISTDFSYTRDGLSIVANFTLKNLSDISKKSSDIYKYISNVSNSIDWIPGDYKISINIENDILTFTFINNSGYYTNIVVTDELDYNRIRQSIQYKEISDVGRRHWDRRRTWSPHDEIY